MTAKVKTIHEFPKGTWLENIDQRPSGQILLTTLTAPHVWQLDQSNPDTSPELIANIPDKKCTLGITSIAPDVFAFIAGAFDMSTGKFSDGSTSVYKLDLTGPPATSKLADIPDGKLPNGMCFLPASSKYPQGVLLTADSLVGAIWAVDVATGECRLWTRDALMAPAPGTIGINGVQWDGRANTLYFSNTRVQGGYLASMPVDPATYEPAGEGLIVGGAAQGISIDDFDLDLDGNRAFVAAQMQHQFDCVDLITGQVSVLAGKMNTTEIAMPTAIKIGRTDADKTKGTVYVCTTGGFPAGIDGVVIGGQVLSINTKE